MRILISVALVAVLASTVVVALLATWRHSVYAAYRAGFFHLFGPDSVLVLLACYCSWAVFRQFSRR